MCKPFSTIENCKIFFSFSHDHQGKHTHTDIHMQEKKYIVGLKQHKILPWHSIKLILLDIKFWLHFNMETEEILNGSVYKKYYSELNCISELF